MRDQVCLVLSYILVGRRDCAFRLLIPTLRCWCGALGLGNRREVFGPSDHVPVVSKSFLSSLPALSSFLPFSSRLKLTLDPRSNTQVIDIEGDL